MRYRRSKESPSRRINVGIYGDTRAGKTRFLYELLAGWERSHRILWKSEEASRFLEDVKDCIAQIGMPRKTASRTPEIEVDIRLPSESVVSFELRDLAGGDLAREVDSIIRNDDSPPEPELRTQISRYDAFLFFFDPTNDNVPDKRREHYELERKRAQIFAGFVHQQRENRYLPIVFVATRRDLLEKDPTIRAECATWLQRTCEQLRENYGSQLQQHFPPSLVECSAMTIEVASTPDGNTEKVVEKLLALVEDVEEFRRRDRRRVAQSVGYGLLLIALVILVGSGISWLVGDKGGHPPISLANHVEDPVPASLSTDEISGRLDAIEAWLAALPSDPLLLDSVRAKQLNKHLAWLLAVRETGEASQVGADGNHGLADRVSQLLHRASTTMLQASLSAPPTLESTETLAACLAELPCVRQPPEQLVRSYTQYWKLYRLHVTEQLGSLVRNQHDAGSEPSLILNRLTDQLDRFVREIELGKVSRLEFQPQTPTDAKTGLHNELVVASQYCKNLSSNGGYKVQFTVTEATYQSKYGITPVTRRLVFESRRQTSPYEVRLQPTAIRETSGSSQCRFDISPDSAADVNLALGAPGALRLGILLKQTQIWEDICTVELQTLPVEGKSLGILGMPLMVSDETGSIQHILPLPEGYEIIVQFSGWHPPPPLLWDVMAIAEKDAITQVDQPAHTDTVPGEGSAPSSPSDLHESPQAQ